MDMTYTYEREGRFFVGWLDEYPEFPTQAFSLSELETNLEDVYNLVLDGTLEPRFHGILHFAVPA
jgi:predicted RNase H-like HicB family nuclease